MCGIAGIINLGEEPVERALLQRLCSQLVHRGPDEEGYWLNGRVGLGQRRLSIIDLTSGKQPMGNEDGSVWVTFNGEIYNFQELRPELEKRGHRFATQSDTEVIVHAYEEYGNDCVKHFRGMFAFALWDEKKKTLLLARDRVGKKPLFYAQSAGQFVFASELQALVQHPAVRREIDPTAIDDYLTFGYVPAPKSIFRGVHKLPPAHYLTLEMAGVAAGSARVERYWQLQYTPKTEWTEEQAIEQLRAVLSEAVRLRLIADVPLGALLSGGIDSSLIVALMSRQSGQKVKTFSIGFEEQGFNELPYARLVAQRYGTDHHELIVRPNAVEILPKLVRHYGEPYADSSAVPSYYVAQLTRQHVKVVLNGDGGDECFAGYERYLGSLLAERYRKVPWLVRRGVLEPLAALVPDSWPRRNRFRQAKRFLERAGQPLAERYLGWVSYFPRKQKQALYTRDFAQQLGGYLGENWLLACFADLQHAGMDHLDLLLAVDVASYLPEDLLVKMDIATMAHSLEARSPFLDHKVMEFAAQLPSHFKVRGTTLKYLLKKTAEQLLPAEILTRRKAGFGVPLADWLRGGLRPLLEDVLLSPEALARGYFQEAPLRGLVAAHVQGKHDHSFPLWALLWLELWHREFIV